MAVRAAGCGEKRVMITSGRKVRITRTMSARTCCRSQMLSVSSAVLGKAEVNRAGEELPAAVQPPRREQFLRARHAQLFAKLGAEHVLSAIAAREREVGRAVVPAAREVGDELRVFIVRMRGDVEHAAHLIEGAQFLENCRWGKRFRQSKARRAKQRRGTSKTKNDLARADNVCARAGREMGGIITSGSGSGPGSSSRSRYPWP